MSKELPYLQFEPAEWLAGDIQNCSLEAQGLFMNIISIYWQRDCEISLDKIKKRFKNDELINELLEENAIKESDGMLIISFCDNQRFNILEKKRKLSEAGRKGGLNKSKATLKPPLSDDKATPKHIDKIREDKIKGNKSKEEYIRKENIIYPFDSKSFFDSWFLWVKFRKEIKSPIKGDISEQA